MYNNTDSVEMNEVVIPEKMSVFKRIGNLFFNPKKLFAYTAGKPTILFPVILVCIISLLAQLLLMNQMKGYLMDQMHTTYKAMGLNYTVDQLDYLANMSLIGTVASTPFIMVGTWVVTTLILYLAYRLAGCEKGLKKYFSMTAYISVITVLGELLHSLYIYFTGTGVQAAKVTSLASLINADSVGIFLYSIAANIDVFNIWSYFLYGIGFIYTGGAKKQKAYIITVLLFVIFTLISAGSVSLSGNLANMLYLNQ